MPCAATIRNRFHNYRLGLQEMIEKLLSDTFTVGLMTIDDWTSNSNRPFMGIFLHWLDSEFRGYECTLDLVPHPYPYNAESIAKLKRETSEHWTVQGSIAALTTANASAMINAAGRAGLERLPYACHILHNLVKATLEKQERLNNVVTKLR
ncbi:hypothetical protein BG015_002828 [Linnemannia schmuckeri]|uniref:Uncharacterized protein n=1 Tax=Linnemannia schmuckeri TaxID=64567 RepID=A0A9P5S3J6_9FUNG|nr:hypothetical protein BG015_002828 [Linnemannia schmuckeri]